MLTILAASSAALAADISVEVTGFRSSSGQALIYVYCSGAGFPTKPEKACRKFPVPIEGGRSRTTISLPAGTYALLAVHDEDRSGAMETNLIGLPREGLGSSNNPRSSFGPPGFGDASFELTGDTSTAIELIYL
jgi:uncharacterized protein (DUF2141 family)